MNDELGLGHRLLDRVAGHDHELKKLDIPTLKKAAQRAGDHSLAAAMDDAVVDGFGVVDVHATAVKFARRALMKSLPADDARLNPQWSNPGTSAAAPRGSGPAPRAPENTQAVPDDDNRQEPPTPVMTSAGAVFQSGKHDPELALRILQALIDNQRRAMGRR